MVQEEVVRLIGPYECHSPHQTEKIDLLRSMYASPCALVLWLTVVPDCRYENEDYCAGSRHQKPGKEGSVAVNDNIGAKIESADSQCECDEGAELEVDIVSSNTHSVINCLSPYLHRKRAEILSWAEKEKPIPGIEHLNMDEDDRFYVLSYYYYKAFPHLIVEREEEERKLGMYILKETEFTGIQVYITPPVLIWSLRCFS